VSAPAMRVDFVARRKRPGTTGLVVLAMGIASIVAVLADYQLTTAEADGLTLRLEDLSGSVDAASSSAGSRAATLVPEVEAVIAELATPWAQLLQDLETANADSEKSVALLSVEPDREHHKVRIFAESRTLPAALTYAERLQQSTALSYPLLDSHEIQEKDPYRPVRFQITAAWRVPQ
jgi:hypothetical protein